MKITLLSFVFMILLLQQAMSNNIQVSNVQLTGQNTTDDFTMVEFDISWENSWRYSDGPANWDAAWIFVKYKIGAGPWQHAWLNNTGHQSPPSAAIENGLLTPGVSFNSTTNPVLGVFLYRNASGAGTFVGQDVQLRWNYGANSVADGAQVDIRVFAIEMVYIPQGSFYVGSGGNESGAFYTYPTTTTPYQITNESSITVGTSTGNLYYNNTSGTSGDQAGPIPAAFPKGFTAFYAMKYEISQSAYVDFLNTLTRQQQINRVRANLMNATVTARFVMVEEINATNRSAICCRQFIPLVPGQVDFFCDLNNNTIPNEVDDGQNIACHYLKYGDVAAYLDWAALRLMTEFEHEKCGRGPLTPVAGEYPWGDHIIYLHLGLQNPGYATEIPSEYIHNVTSSISFGPLRTGAFARASSTRTQAGAGYYGCLDLSGNVWERGITVGNSSGRAYTGVHGNGSLDLAGFGDVAAWPAAGPAIGLSFRGGSYNEQYYQLSNRSAAALEGDPGDSNGGRGVRTSQ